MPTRRLAGARRGMLQPVHRVRFAPSGIEIRAPAGTTLLAAAIGAGLPIARGCGAEGLCGRCGLRILEGGDRLSPEPPAEADVKRRNRVAPELRLACRATIHGDVTVAAPYW